MHLNVSRRISIQDTEGFRNEAFENQLHVAQTTSAVRGCILDSSDQHVYTALEGKLTRRRAICLYERLERRQDQEVTNSSLRLPP